MKHIPKVLIVATSHKTRGGITAVIEAHKKGVQWEKFHCKWIETHIDKGFLYKLLYFIRSFILFTAVIPFYDIIHIHTSEVPSAVRKCFYFFIARLWRKKIIIHFHAFSPHSTIKTKFRPVYKYLFSHADRVVLLSEYWKDQVTEEFQLPEGRAIVIYNPCTTIISSKSYIQKKQILYAGTLNPRKGYSDMINAFALIAPKYPEWEIVFAGNGEIDNGKLLVQQHNIEQRTAFLGWVDGEQKDKAFKEAMIFCLPSYAEGFPMAVLDAWSYGLPVVTTPVGGIPDIAINRTNLLLFTPGDVQTLANNFEELIKDPSLCKTIADEGKKLASTKFNIKTINQEIESLYNTLTTK